MSNELGFHERSKGGGMFFSIKDFSICQVSKTERDGWEQLDTTDRDGRKYTKWIKRYDRLVAFVRKIEFSEREFEGRPFRAWKLHLDIGNARGILDLPLDSAPCNRFMKLAENLDFTKPVGFSAWKGRDGKIAFRVIQDEKTVLQKYTQEHPGKCPPPRKRLGSGKWDWSDQEDFLFDIMNNVIVPKVDAIAGATQTPTTTPSEREPGDDYDEESGRSEPPFDPDDEPF